MQIFLLIFEGFDKTKFISKEEHDKLIKRCHPETNDILLTKESCSLILQLLSLFQHSESI